MNEKYSRAIVLAIITIAYNILEGVVSVYFGIADDQLSLMGFGFDSFIETMSAIGVLLMLLRTLKYHKTGKNKYEKSALRITSTGFFILSVMLIISVIIRFKTEDYPKSTLAGIIISLLSIVSMILLVFYKLREGKKLESDALNADARCNIVCVYMSAVLLITSILVEFFDVCWFDLIGTLGIVYFSVKEGVEAWRKSNGKTCSCNKC
jgi:divalent metal cation (Fe/Co/Zn/Cd) transporter